MTSAILAAAIVRVAFLPPSEWTSADLYALKTTEERETAKDVDEWILRARALAMLAKVLERLFEYGTLGNLEFPPESDVAEFAVTI